MAARRRSHSDGGSGFVAAFVLVLMIGVVIQYFWWIAGAGALVGLFFVGRAVSREVQKRRELAEERERQLQRQADRQHRWLVAGDSRGVYGQGGAAAMRSVAPDPALAEAATEEPGPVATMAATAGEIAALTQDKPAGWEWALFTSILVQRTTPLLPRLRDSELGFTPRPVEYVHSGWQLGRTLVGMIDELFLTASQLNTFMGAPAFMAAFSEQADGSPADAEAIKHVAHRVMDYHERFLELSERCRGLSAPSEYADLIADCAHFLHIPLESYREFIGELVDVIEALPRLLQGTTGVLELGAVVLDIDLDDTVRSRIFKRLNAISRS